MTKNDKKAIDAYRARRAARLAGETATSAGAAESIDDYYMTRAEQKRLTQSGAYDSDAYYKQQHAKHDAERFGSHSSEQARRAMIRKQSYNAEE